MDGKVEDSKPAANDHVFKVPAPKKLYQCKRCPNSYDKIDELTIHVTSSHIMKSIFYYCALCQDSFRQRRVYVEHNLVCPANTFKCTYIKCQRRFPEVKRMEQHARTHRRRPVTITPSAPRTKPWLLPGGSPRKDVPNVTVELMPLSESEVRRAVLTRYEENAGNGYM